MRGYKAFDENLECRGKQYAVGGEYEEDGKPIICRHGMHFCERLADVFDHYPFDEGETRVCEVEALGDVARGGSDSTTCCTNRLKIVRELDWNEIRKLANNGTANTGHHNSGDRNSGDRNSGDCNSGYRNSGDWNTGRRNSGDHNSGWYNSGWYNSGWRNSGYWNSGNGNSGDWNSGNRNSGDCNSGRRNSGDKNSGSHNSGDCNSGRRNSGDKNSGSHNSGRYNIGSWNSGDWNATDFSSGVLCTEVPECLIFDKPSGMTLAEWRKSHASHLLERVPIDVNQWVGGYEMTDEEKAAHPGWEMTQGYLREGTYKKDFTSWWANLDSDEKAEIFAIPNFDPDKFEKITGLHLHDEIPKTKEKGNEDEAPEVTGLDGELIAFLEGHATEEIDSVLTAAAVDIETTRHANPVMEFSASDANKRGDEVQADFVRLSRKMAEAYWRRMVMPKVIEEAGKANSMRMVPIHTEFPDFADIVWHREPTDMEWEGFEQDKAKWEPRRPASDAGRHDPDYCDQPWRKDGSPYIQAVHELNEMLREAGYATDLQVITPPSWPMEADGDYRIVGRVSWLAGVA